ncbi:hypothetical protein C0995_013330 [Termitomyces sp. Mi166|nr:hypothetical protein C0995_013330 [Termitomyces sp. Mi166\
MHFFAAFFATVALILPTFAILSGRYIVMLKSTNATQSLTNKGIPLKACYKIINGCTGTFTHEQIKTLQANPNVEGIYKDGIVKVAAIQTGTTWGLARLSSKHKLKEQDPLYALTQTDFDGRAKWGATFGEYPDRDETGHGTHVAGIIASKTVGVAKQAHIIAVKVVGGDNDIWGLDYVYMLSYASLKLGRRSVVNMSLGYPASKPIHDALAKLTNQVVLVAAAGNKAERASILSPANSQSVITVAASNISDCQTSFSNWGRSVNIFAPGENIVSLGIEDSRAFSLSSGTSMAAAHVSGLAAAFLTWKMYTTAQMHNQLAKYALKNVISGIKDRKLMFYTHVT